MLLVGLLTVVLLYFVDAKPANGSVMCLIHTTGIRHYHAKNVYDMWAHKCDDVLFFTDRPMRKNMPHMVFPKWNKRAYSWKKVRAVYKHVIESPKYNSYDWYLRIDDDAYAFLDTARNFIKNFNPADDLILGFRWGFFVTRGYTDGGSYLISNGGLKTFDRLVKEGECREIERPEDDQEIGRCFERVGIYPQDTRDDEGRIRFFQYHPEETRYPNAMMYIRQISYYPLSEFPDYISPDTISVHHFTPYEMLYFHFLVSVVKIADSVDI